VDLAASSQGVPTSHRFHFPAAEVHKLLASRNCTRAELLRAMVNESSALARPPISQFNVGAVGITPAGDIYIGVNLEFLRMPLNNSVHAEQFLIANLRLHHETDLEMVAVNAAPCGHCRQFYSELACADMVQFLVPASPEAEESVQARTSYSLTDLLPLRFRPQDLLGDDPPPLLLEPQRLPLEFSEVARAAIADRGFEPHFRAAAFAALAEARESYAPYSNCPAGVSIITGGGQVFAGGYLESAAFNPSMQALQVAITDAVINHMPCYTHVQEVVVVEGVNMHVQHAPVIRFMLSFIAPLATVTELPVQRL
jgi:cytidine deaminase